jgi:uncharacterized protein (TIGR02246 family)
MKMFKPMLLAILAMSWFACAQQPHTHEEEKPDIAALTKTFQEMEDAYARAQSAKDAEGVMAYYADDARNMPNSQPVVSGKAAILNRIKKDMATDTSNNVTTFEVLEVFAAGDLAVEIGKSTTKAPDGEVVMTGKYMSLFEKRDGKYVCIRDIWNNDMPVPGE